MPLPPIRCRYYQDDGSPIRDGCWRRELCGFVHPSEPNWDSAPRKDMGRDGERGNVSASRGRGRGRGGAPPSRSSSDWDSSRWGAPSSSAPESSGSGWGSSLTESGDRGKTNGEAQGWGQSSGGWGTTGDSSSGWDSSSWGAPTSSAPESSKGKQVDEPSLPASGTGSGLGNSVDEGSQNETQGRRKPSGGWGTTGDSSSGWNSSSWGTLTSSIQESSKGKQVDESTASASGSGSGWGSSVDEGGNGGKSKSETEIREKSVGGWAGNSSGWDSSSWGAQPAIAAERSKAKQFDTSSSLASDSGYGWGSSLAGGEGGRWDSPSEGANPGSGGWDTGSGWGTGEDPNNGGWGTFPADQKLSRTTTNKEDGAFPMKSAGRSSRLDPHNTDHDDMTGRSNIHPSRAISPTISERSTSTVQPAKSVARRPLPAEEKLSFRTNVIQILNDAVGMQMELNERQRDCDRWIVAQNSIRFARAGRSARTKLDSVHEDYETKLLDTKESLEQTMSALTELPETSRSSLTEFNPDLDEKVLIQYTLDLTEWVEGVRKHLIMITTPPVQRLAPLPATPVGYEEGQIYSPPPAKRRRLSLTVNSPGKNGFTYHGFISQIAHLEDRMQRALEQLEETKVVHPNPNLPDPVGKTPGLPPCNDKLGEQITAQSAVLELSERTDSIGTELNNQAERAASVFTKVHHQELQLQELGGINQGYHLLKAQLQDQLAQFEQSRLQHSVQIRAISEQIQSLHARRVPTPIPAPIFAVEDLVPRVDSTVHEVLQQELLPVLERIRVDCSTQVKHCNQQIYTDIWKNLQPTLVITDNIYRYMESTNTEKHG